jgi:ectoine hydrolase
MQSPAAGVNVTAFPPEEYRERIEKTKTSMRNAGIEVLWITSPPNINYLSGYDAWSFYVHQGLLLALDEAEPIWIGRAIDVPCVRHTTNLEEHSIHGYGDEYLVPPAHAMEFVAALVRSHGWSRSVIGVEMDTHYFTALACARLRDSLPRARIVDADRLVNWVRIIKSPREIEYMCQAGQLTDIAMRAALEMISPGVRQCDVAGVVYRSLISGHPDFHGDVPDYQTMPKGRRTDAPHLSWTAEPYEVGEACTLELGANRYRYHAPLARTAHVGKPSQRLVTLSQVVGEGLEGALAAVKPGATCESIEQAWRDVVAPSGVVKESRIGYSVGIGYPPDWGERTASLMPLDRTELQPNMTFHLMLGIWQAEGGYEISETFRVTERGYACLSTVPRELIVCHDR